MKVKEEPILKTEEKQPDLGEISYTDPIQQMLDEARVKLGMMPDAELGSEVNYDRK